jgi:hypothetical protein
MYALEPQPRKMLAGALLPCPGLPACLESVRSGLRARMGLLSLLAALFFLLSLPTSVAFTVAQDVASPSQVVYLLEHHSTAHHSPERLAQSSSGVGKTPYPDIHRIRGILETEQGLDHALLIATLLPEVFKVQIEETEREHPPILDQQAPQDNSPPRELLSRPPPVR